MRTHLGRHVLTTERIDKAKLLAEHSSKAYVGITPQLGISDRMYELVLLVIACGFFAASLICFLCVYKSLRDTIDAPAPKSTKSAPRKPTPYVCSEEAVQAFYNQLYMGPSVAPTTEMRGGPAGLQVNAPVLTSRPNCCNNASLCLPVCCSEPLCAVILNSEPSSCSETSSSECGDEQGHLFAVMERSIEGSVVDSCFLPLKHPRPLRKSKMPFVPRRRLDVTNAESCRVDGPVLKEPVSTRNSACIPQAHACDSSRFCLHSRADSTAIGGNKEHWRSSSFKRANNLARAAYMPGLGRGRNCDFAPVPTVDSCGTEVLWESLPAVESHPNILSSSSSYLRFSEMSYLLRHYHPMCDRFSSRSASCTSTSRRPGCGCVQAACDQAHGGHALMHDTCPMDHLYLTQQVSLRIPS